MYNFTSHPDKNGENNKSQGGSISMMRMNNPIKVDTSKHTEKPKKNLKETLDLRANIMSIYKQKNEEKEQIDYDNLKPQEWTKDMISNKLSELDKSFFEKEIADGAASRAAKAENSHLKIDDTLKMDIPENSMKAHKVAENIEDIMSSVLNKAIESEKESEKATSSGELFLGAEDMDFSQLYRNDEDLFLKDYSDDMPSQEEQNMLIDDEPILKAPPKPQAEAIKPEIAEAGEDENKSNMGIKSVINQIDKENQFNESQKQGESENPNIERNFIEKFCFDKKIDLKDYSLDLISFIKDKSDNSYFKMRIEQKNAFYINFGASRALYIEVGNLINDNEIDRAIEILRQICLASVDTLISNNAFSKLEDICKRAKSDVNLREVVEEMYKKEEELLALIYTF